MAFQINANTPEECKSEIVKWLNQQASNHRILSSRASRVSTRVEHITMGAAYQAASDFIEKIEINASPIKQS